MMAIDFMYEKEKNKFLGPIKDQSPKRLKISKEQRDNIVIEASPYGRRVKINQTDNVNNVRGDGT